MCEISRHFSSSGNSRRSCAVKLRNLTHTHTKEISKNKRDVAQPDKHTNKTRDLKKTKRDVQTLLKPREQREVLCRKVVRCDTQKILESRCPSIFMCKAKLPYRSVLRMRCLSRRLHRRDAIAYDSIENTFYSSRLYRRVLILKI